MAGGPDGLFGADDSATPLDPSERDGLIPAWITLRHELNAAEQANILKAQTSLFGRRRRLDAAGWIDHDAISGLHRRMFGEVWRWAGAYRRSDRNLGVPWVQVPIEMRQLCDDARTWLDMAAFSPDELAVRFHHRMVWIHPFPNGNGRAARMIADLLVVALGSRRFSWGGLAATDPADIRARYIAALRKADQHDLAPLIAFARS